MAFGPQYGPVTAKQVEDVIRAYALLLDRALPAGVYNLASGIGRRIGDVLDALIARAKVDVAVEVDAQRLRPTDRGVGSAALLSRLTGWAPRVPFETTLERVFSDWSRRVRDA